MSEFQHVPVTVSLNQIKTSGARACVYYDVRVDGCDSQSVFDAECRTKSHGVGETFIYIYLYTCVYIYIHLGTYTFVCMCTYI